MFDAPSFGKEGRAYLVGLGEGIQGALADVPTKVVELDVMKFVNPVPSALQAMSPSHTIRLFTESDMMRYGTPISATWQMEVSDVTTAPVPATNDKLGGTRYTIKPIYKARANGKRVSIPTASQESAVWRWGKCSVKPCVQRTWCESERGRKASALSALLVIAPKKKKGVTEKFRNPFFGFGAGCRTRTRHLMITNQLLYQMS